MIPLAIAPDNVHRLWCGRSCSLSYCIGQCSQGVVWTVMLPWLWHRTMFTGCGVGRHAPLAIASDNVHRLSRGQSCSLGHCVGQCPQAVMWAVMLPWPLHRTMFTGFGVDSHAPLAIASDNVHRVSCGQSCSLGYCIGQCSQGVVWTVMLPWLLLHRTMFTGCGMGRHAPLAIASDNVHRL